MCFILVHEQWMVMMSICFFMPISLSQPQKGTIYTKATGHHSLQSNPLSWDKQAHPCHGKPQAFHNCHLFCPLCCCMRLKQPPDWQKPKGGGGYINPYHQPQSCWPTGHLAIGGPFWSSPTALWWSRSRCLPQPSHTSLSPSSTSPCSSHTTVPVRWGGCRWYPASLSTWNEGFSF